MLCQERSAIERGAINTLSLNILVRISRGSVYYLPRPVPGVPEANLAIMRRLDRLHLEFPFAGSRMFSKAGFKRLGCPGTEAARLAGRRTKLLFPSMAGDVEPGSRAKTANLLIMKYKSVPGLSTEN